MAAKKKKTKKAAKTKATKKKKSPAKTSGKAAKKPARKSKKTVARKSKKKVVKAAAKKAPAKKASAKKAKKAAKKKNIGEGDYAASRKFDKDQAGFVARNKASIPAMGKAAEAELDGPQGDMLRDAEAAAAGRSRDTF